MEKFFLQATNIEEQIINAKEFASIINKAYLDFADTSYLKDNGLKCLITILNDDILEEWSMQGIQFDKDKDFLPINGGIFYVCLFDALGKITPLQA